MLANNEWWIREAVKVPSATGRSPTAPGSGNRFTSVEKAERVAEGRKHQGDWFRDPTTPTRQGGQVKRKIVAEGRKGAGAGAGAGAEWFDGNLCVKPSNSPARKAATAKISEIPLALSSHIARVYRP